MGTQWYGTRKVRTVCFLGKVPDCICYIEARVTHFGKLSKIWSISLFTMVILFSYVNLLWSSEMAVLLNAKKKEKKNGIFQFFDVSRFLAALQISFISANFFRKSLIGKFDFPRYISSTFLKGKRVAIVKFRPLLRRCVVVSMCFKCLTLSLSCVLMM
uniref:Uncharacterized protein n=1 Tax=Cacopsylla melanoneura TaxID=428564 RepID=A0A8D8YLZ5_9HEMI